MFVNQTTNTNQTINLLGLTVRKLGKNANRVYTVQLPVKAKIVCRNGQSVFVVRGQGFSGRYVLA